MIAETGAKMSICGEAHLIARFAKMEIGKSTNESDERTGFLEPIILGGAMAHFHILRDELIPIREHRHHFADGEEIFLGQHFGEAYGHEFDKANRNLQRGGELNQGPDFGFVLMTNEDGIELDRCKS